MFLYENTDGELSFYVEPAYHRLTPMGLTPVLSKYVKATDVERILPRYGFVSDTINVVVKDEEDKPKARAFKHNSLYDGIRVILLDKAPDMDKIIASALFEISKVTFIYSTIYKPKSVQDLVVEILEEKKRIDESKNTADFEHNQ